MQIGKIKDSQRWPFLAIPKAFFRKKPSHRAVLAYVALRYYTHNESQSCERISIKTLAHLVGVSEDTIKRGLDELQKAALLKVHHRTKKTTSGARMPLPNLYELLHIEIEPGDAI